MAGISEIITSLHTCNLLSQLVLGTLSGPLVIMNLIHSEICGSHDNLLLAELLSTSIFMMGISTLLQVTFGVR